MTAEEGGAEVATSAPPSRLWRGHPWLTAGLFLAPALAVLGGLVVYPTLFTIVRSFQDSGGEFNGADNYREMFTSTRTLTAIRNNVIWVVVAPTLVTAVGLVFAVLTERVRWGTAFKLLVFMPMAVSFLAAGVIFRLVYEADPDRGLANAVLTEAADVFRPPGPYPEARPSDEAQFQPDGEGFLATEPSATDSVVSIGLVAVPEEFVAGDAQPAAEPDAVPGAIAGVVWRDFTTGGGGEPGVIDPTELALADVQVDAFAGDDRVGSAETDGAGHFVMDGLEPGDYTLRLDDSTFREPWGGVQWLGPTLVTPAIIGSYLWIWAGFAMVIIAAGLASIPRELLEAARVDGGSEWQVFRRVTVPLLSPVLLVVLITLVINVLKIFDLVLVIPPGSSQDDANVIAVEMWRASFGGARDQGLGSALGVLLFLMVLPAIAFNIRRFRGEEQ